MTQFNSGTYDIIIASDEKSLDEVSIMYSDQLNVIIGTYMRYSLQDRRCVIYLCDPNVCFSFSQPHIVKVKKGKRKKDKESGVARGIDFQFVSNVINFDFPLDVNSYIHRAGRTARGKNQGTALSFVSIRERPLLEEVEAELKHCYNRDTLFKTYQFKLEEVEGFRYVEGNLTCFQFAWLWR